MTKYEIAKSLAREFAVEFTADTYSNMMFVGGDIIAKKIMDDSDKNVNVLSSHVQGFREVEMAIYSALYNLLGGAHGYKLVPIEQSENGGVQ